MQRNVTIGEARKMLNELLHCRIHHFNMSPRAPRLCTPFPVWDDLPTVHILTRFLLRHTSRCSIDLAIIATISEPLTSEVLAGSAVAPSQASIHELASAFIGAMVFGVSQSGIREVNLSATCSALLLLDLLQCFSCIFWRTILDGKVANIVPVGGLRQA
jgi:hypothetical protein